MMTKGNFIIEDMSTRHQLNTKEDNILLFSIFETVEDAIEVLNLDRRHKWYEFNGELIRDGKVLMDCDESPNGKRYMHFPIYAIDGRTGNPVKIS